MLIVRPIKRADYSTLRLCAEESGHGFTSLPVDEALLNAKIASSIKSFEKQAVTAPTDEHYLMVGFDSETGEVAGTTAIEASIGWEVPAYSYHISTILHSSSKLGVKNIVKLLTLGNNYTGCTEICTLFLRPSFRAGLNGKLMSKCRFLLMAEHPERFAQVIIAEMRGISDENGHSPFWKWLQDCFFSIDFKQADYLIGTRDKGFITELMPKLPIYVNLLSPEAQAVIGKVHTNTIPALEMLKKEGFVCRDYVDIFDAGPTVECDLRNIESVRNSFRAIAKVGDIGEEKDFLISNTSFDNFRATSAKASYDTATGSLYLTQDIFSALEIEEGQSVRVLPL